MNRYWLTDLGEEVLRQNEAHIPEQTDLDDLAYDLAALIEDGLVAVTGKYPNLRYCLTPHGYEVLREEKPEPPGKVIPLFTRNDAS